MRSSSVSFSLTALTALILLPASASAQPVELPAITVEGATLEAPRATRPPSAPGPAGGAPPASEAQTQEASGIPRDMIGTAVTVVTGEELRARQIRQVADALRSLPGVSVNRSGGFGNLTQVRIRGGEANQTLVLIDGVEANNTTDGEFDFSNLSAEDIERIEVIRGPMSALYGSNAVGGVINITTRRGQGPTTLSVRSEAGSLGTSDVAARLAGGSRWANFSLGAHLRKSDGFNISPFGDEADGLRLRTFTFRAGLLVTESLNVDFNLRQVDKRADRDGFGGLPNTLATAVDDPSTLHDRLFLGGARLTWDTFNKQLTHQFRIDHNSTTISDRDLAFGPPAFLTSNDGERTTYGYLVTQRFETPMLWAAKHALSGLLERETEGFTPGGSLGDDATRKRDRLSFAGEWRGEFANQVAITAGARHDDNSVFDDFTTWRVSGTWNLRSLGLRPHASIGTAVKFPAMFEQFGKFPSVFFIPNPDLQPEASKGWDAGIEFSLGPTTTLDVTYFHTELLNKIGNSALPAPNPTLINLPGLSTREGLELALTARLSASLTATFAYTFLHAEEPNGVREIRRPRNAARADLGYAFAAGRGSASLGVIYNGAQTDIRFFNDPILLFPVPTSRGLLDAYWLVNASASYKLEPGVELFARVENLFDASYQEVFGFEAAPITAFAGLKLTFGGPEGIGGSWAK
jgi:vitamin B12 transporter